MSSPPASGDQHDTTDEAPAEEAQSPASEEPETAVEPVECPNCGREFADNYCPECGQEADPSASILDVIGGFFRDLVDVESGFWPTFVGLTLRPGAVLRDYLGGVRAGLISPGRYLLAAVIVGVGVDQFLAWIGAGPPPGADSVATPSANGPEVEEGVGTAVEVVGGQISALSGGSYARTVLAFLITALLAVLLYRLFGDEITRMGEALGVSSFLFAHANFLSRGAVLLYVPLASLYAGYPIGDSTLLGIAIAAGYVGFASYQGFGPGWKSAVKGALAVVWTMVEAFSVVFVIAIVYAAGLVVVYPGDYVPAETPTWVVVATYVIGVLLCALPLLLHAGVEFYLRYHE